MTTVRELITELEMLCPDSEACHVLAVHGSSGATNWVSSVHPRVVLGTEDGWAHGELVELPAGTEYVEICIG